MFAGAFWEIPKSLHIPNWKPVLSPFVKARILYDDSAITSKLYILTAYELYHRQLMANIQKKSSWSEVQFEKIDWGANEIAFKELSGSTKITVTKLTHAIVNTNSQNAKYY